MATQTAQLPGQLSLFDEVSDWPAVWTGTFEVYYCPACHSNWGAEHYRTNKTMKANTDQGHELQDDGRCAEMHRHGTTEPYYTIPEIKMVRESGWSVPRPRPAGYRGLDQLKTSK